MTNLLNKNISSSDGLKLTLNVEDGGFSLSVKSNQDLHDATNRSFNRALQKSNAKLKHQKSTPKSTSQKLRAYAPSPSVYSRNGIYEEGKPSQIGSLLVAEA